jgi:hypothetical protein
MVVVEKDRLACGGHKRRLCNRTATITIAEVLDRVLDPLGRFLLDARMVEAAVAEGRAAFEAARRAHGQQRRRLEREKANLESRTKAVVRAIETTLYSRPLALRLRDLEQELDDADRRLASLKAETPTRAPNFVAGYDIAGSGRPLPAMSYQMFPIQRCSVHHSSIRGRYNKNHALLPDHRCSAAADCARAV